MNEQERIRRLEDTIIALEKKLTVKEKICKVLIERVERSLDSVGGAYSIFERNILLQNLVDERSKELEKANKKLLQEIGERIRSEQRLQRLIQGSPIPTFVIGKDHRVLYWNKALEELSGIDAEEMIGTCDHWRAFYKEARPCMADFLVDEDVDIIPKWYSGSYGKSTLIDEAFEATEVFPELGNEPKWLHFTAASIRNSEGEIVGAIETLEDITERKKVEQALKASEELYTKLIATMPDVVVRTDLGGEILFVNDVGLRKGGYSLDDYVGKNMIQFINHDEREKALMNVEKMFKGKISPEEYTIISQDGRKLLFDINGDFLRNEKGTPYGIVFICRDITERRQMEEARQRLEERLRRAEKMELMGTLAGGVAHDLNNVLGVLIGYSELLLETLGEQYPMKKYASAILQSGQRGAAIVQDLLTLARRGVTVSEVLNLNDIISGYFKRPEFEKLKEYHPSIVFKTSLEKNLLNIKGSPVHLEKMVMNLVSNAAEAIEGNGEISVCTENRYLDRPIHGYDDLQEGDYTVLTVTDTGKGIPPDDIDRIFEPFFTKKVMGRSGTGLGLTVVWGTVKDHDGYIDVKSEEKRGSTFSLYFPVTRDELSRDMNVLSIEDYKGKGESILVVDDIKEQRELAVTMLKNIGYQAFSVSSGEEAVSHLQENDVDLMILDMIMEPGMDGLDTFAQVLKIKPHQKAIIVSGFSETGRVRRAQSLGAGAYVKKPYLLETLGLAVRNELDRPVEQLRH